MRAEMKHLTHFFILLAYLFMSLPSSATAQDQDSIQTETYTIYLEAVDYINAYQFDKALESLSTCYIREPQNIDYLSRIAYCHTQLGRYRDAKIYLNEVLKLDSVNTIAISSLGNIYEKERNYVKAKTYYDQLVEIDSTNSFFYKKSGYLAIRLGKTVDGIKHFLEALKFNEKDLEVIDVLSSLYISAGDLDYADQLLRRGLSLDGMNIKLLQNKAKLKQKQKKHKEVIDALEKTMIQGDSTPYYTMLLGVAYLQIDSSNKAIEFFQSIIRRKKDSEYTHHYLGLAYKAEQNFEKSEEHLAIAIDKAISNKISNYYGDLASVFEEQKKYKKAINNFQAAYNYSSKGEYLFFIARNADFYYRDKRIAQKHYQKYLKTTDKKYRNYTENRLKELREIIHFQVK